MSGSEALDIDMKKVLEKLLADGDLPDTQNSIEEIIVQKIQDEQTFKLMEMYDHEPRMSGISEIFHEQNPGYSREAEDKGEWDPEDSVLTLKGEDVRLVIKSLLFFRGEARLLRVTRSFELYHDSSRIHKIATEVAEGKLIPVSIKDQIQSRTPKN